MKVLFTTSFLFLSLFLLGQRPASFDERLLAVYDQAYLEQLQAENPFLLERLQFYLDNAWYLSDYPEDKGAMDFPSVQIEDLGAINILLLEKEQDLRKDFQKEVVYSINGTRKVLIFRSGREFNRLLNEYLQRGYPKRN
ncbi:MAG: hypothetical protein H6563_07885 [Lewinellaceae bacterium]|nr:hypothetical protein [Lewinellaceae bacterium]